jgi:uncharacterized protein (TIGR03083 family)
MTLDHLAQIRHDVDIIADVLVHGPSSAPIAGCPGWTVADLCEHLGGVHRWVTAAVSTGGPPAIDPREDPAPADDLDRARWLVAGARRLIDLLAATAPDEPTWHPFPVEPKLASLWPRRQAHEALVHRWDAQHAVGRRATIDVAWAIDGIDEYWNVMLPRLVIREHRAVPVSAISVQTTDGDGVWHVDGATGSVRVGDAAASIASITGTAESVLLRLWGRPIDPDAVTVDGDESAATAWLELGGA